MDDNKTSTLMLENGFSERQVKKLKEKSIQRSTTLFNMIHELEKRFYRSLFMHIFVSMFVLYAYYNDSKQDYYSPKYIFLYIGVLCIAYFTINFFAPLTTAYKAKRLIINISNDK